jgi:hypothetical protein
MFCLLKRIWQRRCARQAEERELRRQQERLILLLRDRMLQDQLAETEEDDNG